MGMMMMASQDDGSDDDGLAGSVTRAVMMHGLAG